MKLSLSPRGARFTGSILVVTLIFIGVVGLVLLAYLTMVSGQHRLTARSQVWNSCIAVAEAGAEEALSHLNKNAISIGGNFSVTNNLDSNGWENKGTNYYRKRYLDDAYYEVTITPGVKPIIRSTGYVPAPEGWAKADGPFLAAKDVYVPTSYISRTIEVQCRAVGKFTKAIVAKSTVDLNGKYVIVDSYHSYDPTASTYNPTNPGVPGQYVEAKRRDRGDVSVIDGLKDDLNIKAAKVWGKVSTGPDGDLKIDKQVVVGSLDWHAGNNVGVQPGWSSEDANFDMPLPTLPPGFKKGVKPGGGVVGTNTYKYILGNGDWELSTLDGDVYVTGNARLRVTSSINFNADPKSDDGIDFAAGARLEIYMEGKDTKLVGKKNTKKNPLSERFDFNEGGSATNFIFYGTRTPTDGHLEISKMDMFVGMIYAPSLQVTLKGGNPKYYKCHLYGSIQGYSVKLEKNATLHYDENIGGLSADSYVIESWREI